MFKIFEVKHFNLFIDFSDTDIMVLITFFYLLRTYNERKPVQDAFYKLSHYRSPELTRKIINLSMLDCVAVVDVRIVSC